MLDHVDLVALDAFRFDDGGGYPPSYRQFIRTRGWARTFGLWLIYPPVLPGFADGRSRAVNLTARFRAAFADGHEEDYDWMILPDGDWALSERLEVFGWSENGDVLLWDVGGRDAAGEFPVWESRGMNTLHRLGESLTAALPLLSDRAATESVEPLTPVRL